MIENILKKPIRTREKIEDLAQTKHVSEILGIPAQGWSIVDQRENLVMVHYDADAEMEMYGALRGLVVDTEVGAVVADSFGYTPIAVASSLVEEEGYYHIKDEEEVIHSFPLDKVIIKRWFEGVVIRVIWHRSTCHMMTHRKISPLKSRWGSSKTFLEMYKEAGGPTAEQLFDVSKPYSSTCYSFLVVDPALIVGTRQLIKAPYLVFLGQKEMNLFRDPQEIAPGLSKFTVTSEIKGLVTQSCIHEPQALTLDEANNHLRNGYYGQSLADCGNVCDDERQGTGEAIIVYLMEDNNIVDIVKVRSPSCNWRFTTRGDNPNMNNQFYLLLGIANPDIKEEEAWIKLQKRLIIYPLYDVDSLIEAYHKNNGILLILPTNTRREDYFSREARIHLLWINFVMASPPSSQEEALKIITQFKKDRDDLIGWLQELESKNVRKDIETLELSARAKMIITTSRTKARESINKGNNFSRKGRCMTFPEVIGSIIWNFIRKENGRSLYGLVREMKNNKNPPLVPLGKSGPK